MSTLASIEDKSAAQAAVTGGYREVAKLLTCSERHIARLVRERKIPGVIRSGRLVRFHLETVVRWIEGQARAAAD